ncbi:pitrilysin family protein [Arcanobacterium hippocoleae]|uniref:Zn-dependent peptidase n=1 Tax=Arcanobacterium hippocoleae TaxID=149017 RepID=A0ABU1T169_9ACTO|nr:pitrilysin family protein [Arcanobacterium hippocoleae]MDR6939035.1 putative Zn-dependent peptidase [Arcanobacterium hippocoleae]
MTYEKISLPLDTFTDIEFSEDGIIGRRSILPGGIRVLTEKVPGQRSASISFWIGAGSRDEAPGHEGSTHFLEHMLFKGTKTRTSADISRLSDFLGGAINAATSRQYTCYYGRVFSADIPQLLALLVDMITDSTLEITQMETERSVILEELAAAADDVNESVETALLPLVMGEHQLARPVGGTKETVNALTHDSMLDHYRKNYHGKELIVSAAGDIDHAELCRILLDLLAAHGWDLAEKVTPNPRRRVADIVYTKESSELILPHSSRQSAVVMGMPGIEIANALEPVMSMFEIILGGGTSSRLFQEIRENHGLAYSVYSWNLSWNEGGIFAMEAACAEENTEQVAKLMRNCLQQIAQDGVTQAELDTAVNQKRAQLVFAAETNGYRKNRLGYAELFRGELMSITENLRRSREVTPQMVQDLAQQLAASPAAIVRSIHAPASADAEV